MRKKKRDKRRPPEWVAALIDSMNRFVDGCVLRTLDQDSIAARDRAKAAHCPETAIAKAFCYHYLGCHIDSYLELYERVAPLTSVRQLVCHLARLRARNVFEEARKKSSSFRELGEALAKLRSAETIDLGRIRRCRACCQLYWAKKEKSTTCSERCRTRISHAAADHPANNRRREQQHRLCVYAAMLDTEPEITKFNKLGDEEREELIEDFRRDANRVADPIAANLRAARQQFLQYCRLTSRATRAVMERLYALRLQYIPALRACAAGR